MVRYFTDPNAVEPPDMELLYPFVDSALPLAYGVLGILLFHVSCTLLCLFHVHIKQACFFVEMINFPILVM